MFVLRIFLCIALLLSCDASDTTINVDNGAGSDSSAVYSLDDDCDCDDTLFIGNHVEDVLLLYSDPSGDHGAIETPHGELRLKPGGNATSFLEIAGDEDKVLVDVVGNTKLTFNDDLVPLVDGSRSLGDSALGWSALFLTPGEPSVIGVGQIWMSGGSLFYSPDGERVYRFQGILQ